MLSCWRDTGLSPPQPARFPPQAVRRLWREPIVSAERNCWAQRTLGKKGGGRRLRPTHHAHSTATTTPTTYAERRIPPDAAVRAPTTAVLLQALETRGIDYLIGRRSHPPLSPHRRQVHRDAASRTLNCSRRSRRVRSRGSPMRSLDCSCSILI